MSGDLPWGFENILAEEESYQTVDVGDFAPATGEEFIGLSERGQSDEER